MEASVTKDVEVKLSEFDDADVIDYVESLGYVVLEENDLDSESDKPFNHPRNYIDGKEELREHLINILGLGHYVTNYQIITRVAEILE